jgi:hypothetical protein
LQHPQVGVFQTSMKATVLIAAGAGVGEEVGCGVCVSAVDVVSLRWQAASKPAPASMLSAAPMMLLRERDECMLVLVIGVSITFSLRQL